MIRKWKPISNGHFIKIYKNNLKKLGYISDNDINNIVDDATDVLSKCINPNADVKNSRLSSTNLVLGYIQSGKTTSMEAVSCIARDNGFKMIIILSGHVSNLSDQTKKRVYKSLDMYGWDRIEILSGSKIDLNTTNQKLQKVIESLDNPLEDEIDKPSILIVAMKQWQRINKITSIFENAKKSGLDLSKIPSLIIDDEADHYSLDTKVNKSKFADKGEFYETLKNDTIEKISKKFYVEVDTLRFLNSDIFQDKHEDNEELDEGTKILVEREESTTHRVIKRLRQSIQSHTFLGYTATPIANFLIRTVNYLSPKSATILRPGSEYTGAKFFFGQENNKSKYVKLIEEDEVIKNKIKPKTLFDAIRIFILGVAMGRNLGEHRDKKSRSMLVHPSINVENHQIWKGWIEGILKQYFTAYSSKAKNIKNSLERVHVTFDEIEKEFLHSYDQLKQTEPNLPKYGNEFIINIAQAIGSLETEVKEFNADDGEIPFINWGNDGVYARILVGGIGLERGYTIEGLTVSYIVRETGTDDTVYQRARFFGYHKNYIGLVRMYLPNSLIQNFIHQNENEIILRKRISEVIEKDGNLKRDLKRVFPFFKNPARSTIIDYNIKKFNKGGTISDSQAHHLDLASIEENKKIYESLTKAGKVKKCSDITNHQYKAALKNISVIDGLDLWDYADKILNKINFYDDNANDFDIFFERVVWRRDLKKKDLELVIMIMNDDEDQNYRHVEREDFLIQQSRIPIESGANKNRPGHAYLHYEFLINPESTPWISTQSKDSPFGSPAGGKNLKKSKKIVTLQLYRFNIGYSDNKYKAIKNNGFEYSNIPYFRLYIPEELGSAFLASDN